MSSEEGLNQEGEVAGREGGEEVTHGRRTGKGEYVWANGIEKHVGYWNRLEEGKGIRVYESSDVYR
eukprot:746762-Hanusia_phi.AAC.11